MYQGKENVCLWSLGNTIKLYLQTYKFIVQLYELLPNSVFYNILALFAGLFVYITYNI